MYVYTDQKELILTYAWFCTDNESWVESNMIITWELIKYLIKTFIIYNFS